MKEAEKSPRGLDGKQKMSDWTVPKMWEGSTVYMIGGGQSLNTTGLSPIDGDRERERIILEQMNRDLEIICNEKVIGINSAFLLGDWIDICWFGDIRWLEWNKEKLKEFKGMKVCCCPTVHKGIEWVKILKRGKPEGLDPRPDHVSWNKNSGGSGINLAVHLGAKRIVLLGYDMAVYDGGDERWHDSHKIKDHDKNPYPRYLEIFAHIARDARAVGVELINTSLNSAIEERFVPKMKLEDVLRLSSPQGEISNVKES